MVDDLCSDKRTPVVMGPRFRGDDDTGKCLSSPELRPCLTCKSGHLVNFSSPVALQKINPFSIYPNHFYKRGRLVPQRGGSRSSRTRGGMRWTLIVLLTNST